MSQENLVWWKAQEGECTASWMAVMTEQLSRIHSQCGRYIGQGFLVSLKDLVFQVTCDLYLSLIFRQCQAVSTLGDNIKKILTNYGRIRTTEHNSVRTSVEHHICDKLQKKKKRNNCNSSSERSLGMTVNKLNMTQCHPVSSSLRPHSGGQYCRNLGIRCSSHPPTCPPQGLCRKGPVQSPSKTYQEKPRGRSCNRTEGDQTSGKCD